MNFDRTFFVTTITWQRTPLFRNPQRADLMMGVLSHYREKNNYALHEFVVMPDHLHLLITPAPEISLERAVQLIKGGFSYRLGKASPSVANDSSGRKASRTIAFEMSMTTRTTPNTSA